MGLLFSALLPVGCAIVPMKTRTVGTTGKENRMDLTFIQADKTPRDEVATKLAWMDTGLKHQRLFWGRWYGSSSGVGSIFIPTEVPLPIPNGERRWHVHNLLVEFNEKGTVERAGEFSDGKLKEELERWSTNVGEPPLDLSAPLAIEIRVGGMAVPLPLTGDLAKFPVWDTFRGTMGSTFSVPRKDIARFEIHNVWLPGDRDIFWGGGLTAPPSELHVLFSFRHEGPGGKGHCKCYMVEVSPANYLTLVRYMEQTRARR